MNATGTRTVGPTPAPGVQWNAADPVEVRRRIRAGRYDGQTGGLARGYVQANLAILPAACAGEFARFCQRNPKPCPLLATSEPGRPHLPELAADLDLRTDVPSYRVFRNGEPAGDVAPLDHAAGLLRLDAVDRRHVGVVAQRFRGGHRIPLVVGTVGSARRVRPS